MSVQGHSRTTCSCTWYVSLVRTICLYPLTENPFPDPPGFVAPDSPPTRLHDNLTRIAEDEGRPLKELPEEAEQQRPDQAATASALTLEIVGDLP